MQPATTGARSGTSKSNSLQHRTMTYITDAMERILLDSVADRAATEQSRRKTVTQSRGASAEPYAMPAGPPAFRQPVELGGPVSFCRPPRSNAQMIGERS